MSWWQLIRQSVSNLLCGWAWKRLRTLVWPEKRQAETSRCDEFRLSSGWTVAVVETERKDGTVCEMHILISPAGRLERVFRNQNRVSGRGKGQ